MILLIFGTVYAICLAILAIVFLAAKPLPSGRGGERQPQQRDGTGDRARLASAPAGARAHGNVLSTHH